MWNEFHSNINNLGPESEQLLHDLFTTDDNREVDFLERDKVRLEPSARLTQPYGPTETVASVRVRRRQQFFRQTVLNSYGVRCCISGINVPCLLVASHIMPWRDFPKERLDPRNGLCLSSLHDAAFDAGLITLDKELERRFEQTIKAIFSTGCTRAEFCSIRRETDQLARKACGA